MGYLHHKRSPKCPKVFLLITTPKTTLLNTISTSERLLLLLFGSYGYVDTALSGRGHFEDFCAGFGLWHICHVDRHGHRHGHFTLKQLRLSLVNEMHTKLYSGPRLISNHLCPSKFSVPQKCTCVHRL